MATFILRIDDPDAAGPGATRLAVKDLLDVAGTPTTAGSAVVAATAGPAPPTRPALPPPVPPGPGSSARPTCTSSRSGARASTPISARR